MGESEGWIGVGYGSLPGAAARQSLLGWTTISAQHSLARRGRAATSRVLWPSRFAAVVGEVGVQNVPCDPPLLREGGSRDPLWRGRDTANTGAYCGGRLDAYRRETCLYKCPASMRSPSTRTLRRFTMKIPWQTTLQKLLAQQTVKPPRNALTVPSATSRTP